MEDGVGIIPVFFQGFAFGREDRNAGFGDGGSGVVLGGEDVARSPADLGTQRRQRFDQHGGLHGHVQGAGDACAFQRLAVLELLAQGHQARHFDLGHIQLGAAPFGQRDVFHDVRLVRSTLRHDLQVLCVV